MPANFGPRRHSAAPQGGWPKLPAHDIGACKSIRTRIARANNMNTIRNRMAALVDEDTIRDVAYEGSVHFTYAHDLRGYESTQRICENVLHGVGVTERGAGSLSPPARRGDDRD